MRTLVAVLLLASAASADEGPAPVRVTTFLMQHQGIDDQQLVPVMRAIDEALKHNPKLEMKDLDTRLAEFAQEVPQEDIDKGKAAYDEGMKAMAALDLSTAIKKLTAAIDTLIKVLPYIKKQELADAMMALGAAQFEQNEKKAAKATFERLLTWRSDYKVDVNRFPPTLLEPFESSRKEVEHAKRGSLEIRSEPASAQAYVDGRYIGVTPTFAEGLTVGEHFITFKKEGFRKAVTPGTVSPKFQQVVSINLERSAKFLLVQQALDSVERALGSAKLDDNSDNLKEVLFIDHAVFVRAKPGAAGMIDLEVYLYDLRNKKKLSMTTQSVAVDQAEKQSEPVASNLYAKVNYEAEEEAPKDAPLPQAQVRKKFWKTWWFWTATGVVVAGAVVIGVAVGTTQQPKECGSGNFCPGFVF